MAAPNKQTKALLFVSDDFPREMVEQILLNLPFRDLLKASVICKYIKETIDGSISIQRALFLTPLALRGLEDLDAVPIMNPFLKLCSADSSERSTVFDDGNVSIAIDCGFCESLLTCTMTTKSPSAEYTQAMDGVGNMFLTYPALTRMSIDYSPHDNPNVWPSEFLATIEHAEGIRLRDVLAVVLPHAHDAEGSTKQTYYPSDPRIWRGVTPADHCDIDTVTGKAMLGIMALSDEKRGREFGVWGGKEMAEEDR